MLRIPNLLKHFKPLHLSRICSTFSSYTSPKLIPVYVVGSRYPGAHVLKSTVYYYLQRTAFSLEHIVKLLVRKQLLTCCWIKVLQSDRWGFFVWVHYVWLVELSDLIKPGNSQYNKNQKCFSAFCVSKRWK